jgi:hypothetical protein
MIGFARAAEEVLRAYDFDLPPSSRWAGGRVARSEHPPPREGADILAAGRQILAAR